MKKFLAILMTICMMASLLCVPVFAADADESTDKLPEPAKGTLLRITAIKGDDIVLVGDHTNFEDGWNAAMKNANDMEDYGYDRVVVDLYADWNAVGGEFTDDRINGPGFDNDTIYIPADVKVTLNLNGYTINRGLTKDINDGEVMFINDDADVIINNGTITGGYSNSEGGGLYIEGGANVTLNDVHIIDNKVYNDDGAGIYMYGDSKLTVNGGSFKNNELGSGGRYECYGAAISIDSSTAFFNNVEFKDNITTTTSSKGAAIYVDEGTVFVSECTFNGNGAEKGAKNVCAARSVVHGVDSSITVKKSTFTGNGGVYYRTISNADGKYSVISDFSSVIFLNDSTFTMEECDFSKNAACALFRIESDTKFFISDSRFVDNTSSVLYSKDHDDESYFENCTFTNNKCTEISKYYEVIDIANNVLTFYDCDFGNSTFDKDDADYIRRAYSSVPENEAAIRVSALFADGTTAFSNYYKEFAAGWNTAMEYALSGSYDRIVVDIYKDWNAVDGEFCNTGTGFDWDAIYFPANVKVTLNMNGHTINRGITVYELNGEVMCIENNADVIINDGTITGGNSINGAGGIHIRKGAKVTLNNVNIVGNMSSSDGGGIAIYDRATLIMNGGSFKNNVNCAEESDLDFGTYYGGAVYVNNSSAIFNGVEFKNNTVEESVSNGDAIYADNGNVTLNECTFDGNGIKNDSRYFIYGDESSFVVNNSTFINNAAKRLFYFDDSSLTMEGGKITGSTAEKIFFFDDSKADIKGTTITDNASGLIYVDNGNEKVTMIECAIGNNAPAGDVAEVQVEAKGTLVITDCDLGDTTFENKNMVSGVGSMIGEGSISMILSLLAIFVAGVAFIVVISRGKKKGLPHAKDVGSTVASDE